MQLSVVHVLDSGGFYGAEMILGNLCNGLEAEGVTCKILNLNSRFDLRQNWIARGFHSDVVSFSGNPFTVVNWILRKTNELGGALIHSHGYKPSILLGSLPRFSRPPLVRTMHGWTTSPGLSRMGAYSALDSIFLRRHDALAVVTRSMMDNKWIKSIHRSIVVPIENGIDDPTSVVGECPKHVIAWLEGAFLIVTVGRLSSEKNHHALILAIRNIVDRGFDVRLLILGDGPLRRELEVLGARLLAGRVKFVGVVPNPLDFIGKANLFVLPSLTEGLPVCVLEAMALNVPIVATAVGGVEKLLKNVAVLVPPGDVSALEYGISVVISGYELARTRAKQARDRFTKEYTTPVMVNKYLNLYCRVVKRSKSHG